MTQVQPVVRDALALFPLGSVLFPGGVLSLKIFETRYVDLIARCLRDGEVFGVVALTQGTEVRRAGQTVAFEHIGVLATLTDCDSSRPGIMQVRCRGGSRFACDNVRQLADGLWVGRAVGIADDTVQPPAPEHAPAVEALKRAIHTLENQGRPPFPPPWHLDDAGWVANRWCELLPLPLAARQKLMELGDPQARLGLVHDYLRQHQVVKD